MGPTMQEICDDLAAEQAEVLDLVAGLDADGWSTPTPSPDWAVRDQVGHLAFFDEKAVMAVTAPEAFVAETAALLEAGDLMALERHHVEQGRGMEPTALLAWWHRSRLDLQHVYRAVDPRTRVPWYGPPMAATSMVTARIMETWAHGQDVRDALGVDAIPTGRLRHVCHLGVRARGFAFDANGLDRPGAEVRVELTTPTGTTPWVWGPEDAADRVTGDALGFALLVTQRRHRDDVDVVAHGPVAETWLGIAQAFAGPPGAGRRPGQFD